MPKEVEQGIPEEDWDDEAPEEVVSEPPKDEKVIADDGDESDTDD